MQLRSAWIGILVGIGGLTLALWTLQAGSGDDAMPAMAPAAQHPTPNVVFVIACTLRRDQTSPYGALDTITPHLSRFADGGARFDHAVAAAPWTRAAATALVTGRHPIEIGMVEPEDHPNQRRLAPEVVTLAERLHDAGFETIGLTANPNLNRIFGFDQGFDDYYEAEDRWREGQVAKVSALHMAREALDRVDDRRRPDAPLFLRVVTMDPHQPISVPPRRIAAMQADGVPRRVGAYRVEVQRWDQGIDVLWQGLVDRGYTEDNTILVVVNDHGEGLSWPPEHGVGHGNFLLPSAVDMPWIVYGAGIPAGHRIGGVASGVDVHPTILGLVGIDRYDGPGHDLSPQVRGRADRSPRDHAFTDTWFVRSSRTAIYTEDRLCLHDFRDLAEQEGGTRLLPRTACFDRRQDPAVRTPLPAPDPRLIDTLVAWRSQMEDRFAAWPHHQRVEQDDALSEHLESLGYTTD